MFNLLAHNPLFINNLSSYSLLFVNKVSFSLAVFFNQLFCCQALFFNQFLYNMAFYNLVLCNKDPQHLQSYTPQPDLLGLGI